jgi:hypothetical protein
MPVWCCCRDGPSRWPVLVEGGVERALLTVAAVVTMICRAFAARQ